MASQWDAHLDQLAESGTLSGACILSSVDGKVLASSPDCEPKVYKADITNDNGEVKNENVKEAANILKMLSTGKAHPHGLRFNNTKYMFIKGEMKPHPLIQGRQGQSGIIISKTPKAILIGLYDEDATAANVTVEGLGDYLRGKNSGCCILL